VDVATAVMASDVDGRGCVPAKLVVTRVVGSRCKGLIDCWDGDSGDGGRW
jgi:hypothetical protein